MAVAPPSDTRDDDTIVSSVDGDGDRREYVIADISEDGAWLAMCAGDAPELSSWR